MSRSAQILWFSVMIFALIASCAPRPPNKLIEVTHPTHSGVVYYDVYFEINPSEKTFRSEQKVYLTGDLMDERSLFIFIGEDLVIDHLSLAYESGAALPILDWRVVDIDRIEYWWGQTAYAEIEIQTVEEITHDELLILNLQTHLPEEAIGEGLAENFYDLFVSATGSHAGGPESGAFPMVAGNLSAPFTITIKHPDHFQCALPGEQVEKKTKNGFSTTTFQADIPYDPSFSCAPYKVTHQESGELLITLFTPVDLDLSPKMIERAAQTLSLYQDLFGKPLADSFRIVFPPLDNENGGGESNGNIIFLGDIQPFLNYEDDEVAQDMFTHLMAHEGYHLWNTWELTWEGRLAEWWVEGGANFMASWAKEMLLGEPYGVQNRLRSLEDVIEQEAYLHKNSLANLDDSWFEDWALVYDYGALVWEQLRQKLGDEALVAGLREFFQSFSGKTTNYQDFITSMEKHTDIDVAAALDPWVQHNPKIDLILLDVRIQPVNGSFAVEVDLEVNSERDYEVFTALGYRASSRDDWSVIDLHLLERGEHLFQFISVESPLEIQIDPEYRVPQIDLSNDSWAGD